MKAVICGEFGFPKNLKIGKSRDPLPKENQVSIKIEVCGASYPDLLIIQNKYQLKPDPPLSPGGKVVG